MSEAEQYPGDKFKPSPEAQKLKAEHQQAAYEAYMRIWTPQADAYFDAYNKREQLYDVNSLQNILTFFNGTEFYTLITADLKQKITNTPAQRISAIQVGQTVDRLIKRRRIVSAPDERIAQAALVKYKQLTKGTFHPRETDEVYKLDFLDSDEMLVKLEALEALTTIGELNEGDGEEEVPLLDTKLTQYTLIKSGETTAAIPILETQNLQARKRTSHISHESYTYQELQHGKSFISLLPEVAEFTETVKDPIQPILESLGTRFPPIEAEVLREEARKRSNLPARSVYVQISVGKHFDPHSIK